MNKINLDNLIDSYTLSPLEKRTLRSMISYQICLLGNKISLTYSPKNSLFIYEHDEEFNKNNRRQIESNIYKKIMRSLLRHGMTKLKGMKELDELSDIVRSQVKSKDLYKAILFLKGKGCL